MAKKKKQNGKGYALIAVFAVVVLIVVIGIFALRSGETYNREDVDAFAQCITENGAVMYGAFWCPHCARTKKLFGESFRHVAYVECDPRGEEEQSEFCIEKQIQEYDTWEFNDDPSNRLIGEPSFAELSEKTGCPVPEAV